jgi:hypothetical protein
MYSIVVSADITAWEGSGSLTFDVTRFGEYNGLEAAESDLSVDRIESLKKLEQYPIILMYERDRNDPRADIVRSGLISNLRRTRNRLAFDFHETGRTNYTTVEALQAKLQLDDFEFSRTHWSIKDGALPSEFLLRIQSRVQTVLISKGDLAAELAENLRPYPLSASVQRLFESCPNGWERILTQGYKPQLTPLGLFVRILSLQQASSAQSGRLPGMLRHAAYLSDESLQEIFETESLKEALREPVHRRPLLSTSTEKLLRTANRLAGETARDQILALRHLVAILLIHIAEDRTVVSPKDSTDFKVMDGWADAFAAYFLAQNHADSHAGWLSTIRQFVSLFPSLSSRDTGIQLQDWILSAAKSGFAEGPPGYHAEFCGLGQGTTTDNLGINDYVGRFAELIALRETKLPLAIGLFGNWGAGKSHFMNLLDSRLQQLSAREKSLSPAQGQWCKEIVPVYFNAWHYFDTNLWASLVSHIFESLFERLRGKEGNPLEKIQLLLAKASGTTARAAEQQVEAKLEREKAEKELAAAKIDAVRKQTFFRGLIDGLDHLLPEVSKRQINEEARDLIGNAGAIQTLEELERAFEQAQGLTGRCRAAFRKFWQPKGRAWRLGWLTGTILVPMIFVYLAAPYIPLLQAWKEALGLHLTMILTGLGPVVLWFGRYLSRAKSQIDKIENWIKQASEKQMLEKETPTVRAANVAVITAEAREHTAEAELIEARAIETKLKLEAVSLLPEHRLRRFIEERAHSNDYRGQLGLVSLARRDFAQLSLLFADKTAPVPNLNGEDLLALELARSSVDRIVLFVDDLDRCQTAKVVEILQAVHLLLAFPLFAVVVGVDQRCLRQSLTTEFRGLVTDNLRPPAANEGALEGATALDYLEKIFHIPFHLPPMAEAGFGRFIDGLTTSTRPASETAIVDEIKRPDSVLTTPATQKIPPPSSLETLDPITENKVFGALPPAPIRSATESTIKTVGSVPLHAWEISALRDYHGLIATPRAGVRFVNTYRLVRAGVPASEWIEFCGDHGAKGEFRLAMLFLACAAGSPASAREWFNHFRNDGLHECLSNEKSLGSNKEHSDLVKAVYLRARISAPDHTFSTDAVGRWLDRVSRFTF